MPRKGSRDRGKLKHFRISKRSLSVANPSIQIENGENQKKFRSKSHITRKMKHGKRANIR
jgi:hypothetical protein